MQPNEKLRLLKYLQDGLDAAIELQKNTTGISSKKYEITSIKWIVERGKEIISEALKRASFIESNLLISDINKIFATRNKIAHEYDIIDSLFTLYNCSKKYSASY